MNEKRLGLLDVLAVVAAGVLVVGTFLPLSITEYPVMTITADLLDFSGGIVAILAALAAIVLAFRRMRIAAIVAFAAAGSIILWWVIDLGAVEGSRYGYGVYVMAVGFIGGVAFLTTCLVRGRLGSRLPEDWTPTEAAGDALVSTGSSTVDADDPLLVLE